MRPAAHESGGAHRDHSVAPSPAEIAPHIVIEIAFDTDDHGREIAIVEGLDIVPREGEDARDAAIRAVAEMVETAAGVDAYGNPYCYLRARIVGDNENRSVVIHRDGRLFVSFDANDPTDHTHEVAGPAAPGGPPDHVYHPGEAAESAGARDAAGPRDAAGAHESAGVRDAAGAREVPEAREAAGSTPPPFAAGIGEAANVLLGVSGPGPQVDEQAHLPQHAEQAQLPQRAERAAKDGAGHAATHDEPGEPRPASPAGPRALLRGPTAATRSGRRARPAVPKKASRSWPGRSKKAASTRRSDVTTAAAGSPRPVAGAAGAGATAVGATVADARVAERGVAGASAAPAPVEAADPAVDRAQRRARLMELARRETEEAGRATSRVSRARRSMALIAAAAVTVVLAILLVVDKLDSPNTPAQVIAGLPVAPPPEWAAQATWSTGPLATEAGPTVGLGERVAYVTADRGVVVADIVTGDAKWRVELPDGDIAGPLSRTRLVQTDAVALHVGDRLLAWSVDDGKPVAAVDLPAGAQVTYLGAAPLVGVGPSTVAVVGSEGLIDIAVPEGAYALAARTDSSVTAAAPAGWWHLRAGRPSGAARPWENPSADSRPADSLPSIKGYAADSVIVMYPAFRDRPSEVVVHTDRAGDLRASFRGPVQGSGSAESTWIAAPGGAWGVLGRTLVDIRAGSVSDLGAWQTRMLTADHAFGLVGEQLVAATPGAAPAVLPAGTQEPETTTSDGAVIRLRGPISDDDGTLLLAEGAEAAFVVPPAK